METINTEVSCAVCKADMVVARLESVTQTPMELIPLGPGSKSHYHLSVTSFYCQGCGVKYEYPPGKPDAAAEILKNARDKERQEDELLPHWLR
ncbi:MAG: hypothetical protein JWN50_734 [Parcubacteria group bacterium]|nr:hypothetical protein [Parcubacteria group bacterium]